VCVCVCVCVHACVRACACVCVGGGKNIFSVADENFARFRHARGASGAFLTELGDPCLCVRLGCVRARVCGKVAPQ
jgi:hypothetical protein